MSTKTKFHVGLHVTDISKSVAFYTDLLQSESVKIKDDYAKFETDAIVLSLIKRPSKVQPNFGHFGLRVDNEEQLQSYHQHMKSAGHTCREEEQVDCCYAVQDKFWVSDPDGVEWEVYRFIKDTHDSIKPVVEAAGVTADCCGPECC